MGITIGSVPTEAGNFKMFTGLIDYKVVAINPNIKELEGIGITYIKREPEYTVSFGDNSYIKVEFWLESQEEEITSPIKVPISFLVGTTPMTESSKGSLAYIDECGKTSWVKDKGQLRPNNYFSNKNARVMHQGEDVLNKFMGVWLNTKFYPEHNIYDTCRLDITKLLAKDFSELKETLVAIRANEDSSGVFYKVKPLTGVSSYTKADGSTGFNYRIYNKNFYKSTYSMDKATAGMQKFVEAEGDYNQFSKPNKPISYSYYIEEFDKDEMTPDSPPSAPSTGAAPSTFTPADDLPF